MDAILFFCVKTTWKSVNSSVMNFFWELKGFNVVKFMKKYKWCKICVVINSYLNPWGKRVDGLLIS